MASPRRPSALCPVAPPVFLCCDITCRPPRLTASRNNRQLAMFAWVFCFSKAKASGRVGRRGATAETTPKALPLLVWTALSRLLAADGKTALLVPGSGYETECYFFVQRSLACLPACPFCLRTVFTCLPAPTGTLIGPLPVRRLAFLRACCLWRVSAPVALPGLGSLASPVHVPGNPD